MFVLFSINQTDVIQLIILCCYTIPLLICLYNTMVTANWAVLKVTYVTKLDNLIPTNSDTIYNDTIHSVPSMI